VSDPAQNGPSLEEAMKKLDAIVREMESGDLPLEKLISRYEEGVALSKLCQERLDRAEERIRIIAKDSAGNPVVEDFEGPEE
jgi:exodeoxyribonuclease VII, small subunit